MGASHESIFQADPLSSDRPEYDGTELPAYPSYRSTHIHDDLAERAAIEVVQRGREIVERVARANDRLGPRAVDRTDQFGECAPVPGADTVNGDVFHQRLA